MNAAKDSQGEIRMLAVDLDGTLMGQGPIDRRDIESLHRAREAGIEVILATGRSWVESRKALDQLALDGVMVAAGGAMLQDVLSGRTLHRSIVDPQVITEIAHSLLAHGHVVNLLQDPHTAGFDYWMVGTAEVDPATTWWFKDHNLAARWVDELDQVDSFEHTVRVGTVALSSKLEGIAEQIREDLADRVFLQHWQAVVESEGEGTHLLEAFAPSVDKWTMLQYLAQERGFEPRHIAAIGDGLNDIGMLRGAGIGIVMAGAEKHVQSVADRMTGPLGGGVAEAVEELLSSR